MVVLLTACFHEASIAGPRSPLESGRRNHTMSFSTGTKTLSYFLLARCGLVRRCQFAIYREASVVSERAAITSSDAPGPDVPFVIAIIAAVQLL